MSDDFADTRLAAVAGAIAEPARARMLCCLMDGHARTNTELAVVAEVTPSTASVHLAKLREQQLVNVLAQGKHRYYTLAGGDVAAALEALLRVAGLPRPTFVPNTPERLRKARTCYDHMAGTVAVGLHDYMASQDWLVPVAEGGYRLSEAGTIGLERLGLQVEPVHKARRRFACACLDWSERKPHLGGALGAALLELMVRKRWIEHDLDSRALGITAEGKRQFKRAFNLEV
ncbi:MAG TPA: metalloregulator ArsR/SmtB family transcription factor [Telluria sp.]|nr:metalloregulator ArsR/SmtB family transcription factor [Telluria sp.]